MRFGLNASDRVLTFTLALIITIGSLVWTQASVAPATAQEPEEPNLTIQIVPERNQFRLASLGTIPTFDVGDTFRVSIIALGIGEPGIFGSQFEIIYDARYLKALTGSLAPGSVTQPVLNPVNEIDQVNGLVRFAASRQGNLDNLTGNVVLATLRFEAIAPTEPPSGQTTTIDLDKVKLGAKGGLAVPVSGIVDLDVIIRGSTCDPDCPPGPGDIIGNVKVEGRAADNQAGHRVTAVGVLAGVISATTVANGDFLFDNASADTYELTAERPGFLDATCASASHPVMVLTSLEAVTLLAGDIDDNRAIDITDAVAIGTVFGGTTPGEVADLNADGGVDILDLILMAANFGQTWAGHPWNCQLAVEL